MQLAADVIVEHEHGGVLNFIDGFFNCSSLNEILQY